MIASCNKNFDLENTVYRWGSDGAHRGGAKVSGIAYVMNVYRDAAEAVPDW